MLLSPSLLIAIASVWPGDIAVQVVDAKHTPVQGAWVAAFVATGAGFMVGEYGDQGIDAIQNWIDSGATGSPEGSPDWTATDADGRASVFADPFWIDVVAVTPTTSGHAILARGSVAKGESVTIELKPNRFWRVPVVDGVDRNVRPVVSVEFGTEGDLHMRDSFHRITRRTTAGADNAATLGPIDLLFDPLEIDPTIVARLDLPIDPAPRLRRRKSQFEADVKPAPPLVVPPHGSIEVRIVDESGKLVTRPDSVTLKRDINARVWTIWWLNSDLGTWRKPTQEGIARFDFAGVGAMLTLEGEDGPFRFDRKIPHPFDQAGSLAPLTGPGERRVVTLATPDQPKREVLVRGRLHDAAGQPLARREISVDFCLPTWKEREGTIRPWWSRWDGLTAGDGGFEKNVEVPEKTSEPALLIVSDAGGIGHRYGAPLAAKCIAIEKLDQWLAADLGDLRLEPLPLLVGGRAVDQAGEPIANLFVSLECNEKFLNSDPSVPAWWNANHSRPSVKTSRDGRFEVHGFAPKADWKLSTWNDQFGPERNTPIVPGSADLAIRLERGRNREDGGYHGAIAGTLLLDPDVPRNVVVLSVAATNDVGSERDYSLDCGWEGEPGDRVGVDSIPIGSCTVTASFRDLGSPKTLLVTIPDVRIDAGKTTTLAPIDLRGRIKVKHLSILDRSGAPVVGGYVIGLDSNQFNGESRLEFNFFHDGESVVCCTDRWPELRYVADGFRLVSRRFDNASAETIVLPPALRVDVCLPDGLILPPMPLTLEVSMGTDAVMGDSGDVGRTSNPPKGAGASFDAGLVAELCLPAAGSYNVTVNVSRRESGPGFSHWRGSDVLSRKITIAETDDPIRIDLDVTQAAIDTAVKQLGN